MIKVLQGRVKSNRCRVPEWAEHNLNDTALLLAPHLLWIKMFVFLLSRFPVAAGHMHHKVCFVNALFPEIKSSAWWPSTCQNKWFDFCCAVNVQPYTGFFGGFMSSAILLKLIHPSNKAFSIVTKIPSYFKLCHLLILSGNFSCAYLVSHNSYTSYRNHPGRQVTLVKCCTSEMK